MVTIDDPDYDDVRTFRLFDEGRVVRALRSQGMELVSATDQKSLGGLMYYVNNNGLKHCAFWTRKVV